jgi:hypothetical protein
MPATPHRKELLGFGKWITTVFALVLFRRQEIQLLMQWRSSDTLVGRLSILLSKPLAINFSR